MNRKFYKLYTYSLYLLEIVNNAMIKINIYIIHNDKTIE